MQHEDNYDSKHNIQPGLLVTILSNSERPRGSENKTIMKIMAAPIASKCAALMDLADTEKHIRANITQKQLDKDRQNDVERFFEDQYGCGKM